MKARYLYLSVAIFGLGACDQVAQNQMDGIYAKVADDAEKQYAITKQAGGKIDQCVQAGMVAAAYLQAQDQQQYSNWKSVESVDCAAAGIAK